MDNIFSLWFVVLCFQLVRKQKQTEEDKRATAPAAVCDEASTSGFTDIPLSLPYQEPEEEQKDPVKPAETTAQPSDLSPVATKHPPDLPSEKQQTSSSHTLPTSVSTKSSQGHSASDRVKEEDWGVAAQGAELKDAGQTTELGRDTQSWNQPCVSTQFQIPNAPSAPALYPSLPTLEEGPMIQLCEEAVKNGEKGPAVLALPEQESSPPSLQPLKAVAELSRSKLYPELPKTAPEIQVIS